ncbi:MAG: hypothetical protein JNG88_05355 [Phycisphaerales bacterium]|nr:hypothetical protein [Phycisphaerales bacterium]
MSDPFGSTATICQNVGTSVVERIAELTAMQRCSWTNPVLDCEAGRCAPLGNRVARGGTRRIDLHCHSTFSDETVRWLPGILFHPLLTPEETYRAAKSRGMDFVTITDHDTIDGCKALLDRHGPLSDFIIGEEVSVVFPDDKLLIHVNVFDINEEQHREIQRVRTNIHEFVDYVRRIDKLFVLNHMTWNEQHRPLTRKHIEIMLQLFPIFEGINGTRSYAHNAFAWFATRGHDKVLVGGSDSHTNRVGTTYTLTRGESRLELIAAIRAGQAEACGAFGTAEKFREDVWTLIQKNMERRVEEATSAWERTLCRIVRRVGRVVYPTVCLGYHARQASLIRDSLREVPEGALAESRSLA